MAVNEQTSSFHSIEFITVNFHIIFLVEPEASGSPHSMFAVKGNREMKNGTYAWGWHRVALA